jgi:hypothetical protein
MRLNAGGLVRCVQPSTKRRRWVSAGVSDLRRRLATPTSAANSDTFKGGERQRPVSVYSGGNVVKAVMEASAAGWMVETWFLPPVAVPSRPTTKHKDPYIRGVIRL